MLLQVLELLGTKQQAIKVLASWGGPESGHRSRRKCENAGLLGYFLANCMLGESFNAQWGGTDNGGPSISKRAAALLVDCQPPVDLLSAANLPLIEVVDELKEKRLSTSAERLAHTEARAKDGWKANEAQLSRRWCIITDSASQVSYLARSKAQSSPPGSKGGRPEQPAREGALKLGPPWWQPLLMGNQEKVVEPQPYLGAS